jgi:hypothetical protein
MLRTGDRGGGGRVAKVFDAADFRAHEVRERVSEPDDAEQEEPEEV